MDKIDEPYIPETGREFPEDTFEHIYRKPKKYEFVFDDKYPYLDKSLGFRIKSAIVYLAIYIAPFIVSPLRFGLRIEGRKNLKKFKEHFKNGAMTMANHIHRWDFMWVLLAVRYRRLFFPAWADNVNGSEGHLIRLVGGIPIPKTYSALNKFNEAFDTLHKEKRWLHAYPEQALWEYYQHLRPFKKGVFTMAYNYKLPIIPLAFSYRKAAGVFRLFKKNLPLITLRIGEPLLPEDYLKSGGGGAKHEIVQRM
ncbi:MAG: 1-acyl-sn-glycerol-3-phosphate acyltransferase, partial [Spirochaetaceae bacterium]|nr:1-acyl-sn-glycerol-3-phosphate acyltransferase [Spirochaetaceae bacterium]